MRVDHAPVRLTRRGRMVVLGFFLVLGALGVVLAAPASRAAIPAVSPAPVVVVRPGDTLWAVAERHVGRMDRRTAIEEIRRLNGLDDYTVHAGQHLVLPRG